MTYQEKIDSLLHTLEILHPRDGQWITPNDEQAKEIDKIIKLGMFVKNIYN